MLETFSNGNTGCQTDILSLIDKIYDILYSELQPLHIFMQNIRKKDIIDPNTDILTFYPATESSFWIKASAYAVLIENIVDETYISWSSHPLDADTPQTRWRTVQTLYHYQRLKQIFEKRYFELHPEETDKILSADKTAQNLELWESVNFLFESPNYWTDYISLVKNSNDTSLNGADILKKITLK